MANWSRVSAFRRLSWSHRTTFGPWSRFKIRSKRRRRGEQLFIFHVCVKYYQSKFSCQNFTFALQCQDTYAVLLFAKCAIVQTFLHSTIFLDSLFLHWDLATSLILQDSAGRKGNCGITKLPWKSVGLSFFVWLTGEAAPILPSQRWDWWGHKLEATCHTKGCIHSQLWVKTCSQYLLWGKACKLSYSTCAKRPLRVNPNLSQASCMAHVWLLSCFLHLETKFTLVQFCLHIS